MVPPGYGRRRFWKIYPPLALSLLLLTPLFIVQNGDVLGYTSLAGKWLVGWPLVHPVSGRLNPVMWRLVVEVQFYILLPLLFLLLKRVSAKCSVWLIFSVLLVIPTACRWWHLAHGVKPGISPDINLYFPSLLDAFAFGVLVAGLEQLKVIKKSWARAGDVGCILLAIAMVSLSWLSLHPVSAPAIESEVLTFIVKSASALMLCYVADANHPRSRLFSARWLRWCGLISYEWYLFHQPIQSWSRLILGPANGNVLKYVLIVGGALVVGLAIGATVYRFFSLPILRYGRNRRGVL